MADDNIGSRALMQRRGAAAFAAGRMRNSHGMNPCASALVEWLAGFDRASDEFYHATLNGNRLDVTQAVLP